MYKKHDTVLVLAPVGDGTEEYMRGEIEGLNQIRKDYYLVSYYRPDGKLTAGAFHASKLIPSNPVSIDLNRLKDTVEIPCTSGYLIPGRKYRVSGWFKAANQVVIRTQSELVEDRHSGGEWVWVNKEFTADGGNLRMGDVQRGEYVDMDKFSIEEAGEDKKGE